MVKPNNSCSTLLILHDYKKGKVKNDCKVPWFEKMEKFDFD